MKNREEVQNGGVIWQRIAGFFSAFGSKVKEELPFLLLVVAVFSFVLFSRMIPGEKVTGNGNVYLSITVIEFCVFVLPAMIFARYRGMDFIKKTNMSFPGFSTLAFVFFMLLVLIFSNVLITLAFYSGTSPVEGEVSTITMSFDIKDPDILGIILIFAVIPAICEEFVFRAIIMSELKKYGYLTAIIISSIMFALIHYNNSGFVIYFFSGLLLGLTAYVTRSVGAAMLLHIMYNIYGLFFESYLWGAISRNVNLILVVFIAAVVLLVSLMVCFFEAERMFNDYSVMGVPAPESYVNRDEVENADELIAKRRKKSLLAFISPTLLAAVAIYMLVVSQI